MGTAQTSLRTMVIAPNSSDLLMSHEWPWDDEKMAGRGQDEANGVS